MRLNRHPWTRFRQKPARQEPTKAPLGAAGTSRRPEGVINGQTYPYPHCNGEVLHAPGHCVYCDAFPDRQSVRAASGGAFTPDEANGWQGNVAVPVSQP